MNTQEWLALISLMIAVVGAIQTIVVSYFGRAAKGAALDAASTASTAAAQVLTNSNKLDEVKTIVNGQTSDLIAHNQTLQATLAEAGIIPPPPPTIPIPPPTDP